MVTEESLRGSLSAFPPSDAMSSRIPRPLTTADNILVSLSPREHLPTRCRLCPVVWTLYSTFYQCNKTVFGLGLFASQQGSVQVAHANYSDWSAKGNEVMFLCPSFPISYLPLTLMEGSGWILLLCPQVTFCISVLPFHWAYFMLQLYQKHSVSL